MCIRDRVRACYARLLKNWSDGGEKDSEGKPENWSDHGERGREGESNWIDA